MKFLLTSSCFLLLLAFLGCRSGDSMGTGTGTPVPEAGGDGTPGAPGRSSARGPAAPIERGVPPVVGGLFQPGQLAWYEGNPANPLAFLFGRHLHRSLLDRTTGEPELAVAWSLSGNSATFALRPDAQWHDGRPMYASEVVDLLQQEAEAGNLPGLEKAEARDRARFEIELAAPSCPALMRIATMPIVASKAWPPERTSGRSGVVEADGGWRLTSGAFSYRRYPDELALREAWEQGEINSIIGVQQLTGGPLPGLQVHSRQPGPLLATLLFQLDDALLEKRVIREALTLATDRAALYRSAYGSEPPALLTALLPPDHWAAPDLSPPADPDRAAALLRQNGWRDRNDDGVRENEASEPLRLELILPLGTDLRWDQLAQHLAEQWAAVGVDLTPLYVEEYSLKERLTTGRWQVALITYRVAADPDQRALWSAPEAGDLIGQDLNVTNYDRAAVNRLLDEGATLPGCTIEDRRSVYHAAWAQLLDDRPLWPLFPLPLDGLSRPGAVWPDSGQ